MVYLSRLLETVKSCGGPHRRPADELGAGPRSIARPVAREAARSPIRTTDSRLTLLLTGKTGYRTRNILVAACSGYNRNLHASQLIDAAHRVGTDGNRNPLPAGFACARQMNPEISTSCAPMPSCRCLSDTCSRRSTLTRLLDLSPSSTSPKLVY